MSGHESDSSKCLFRVVVSLPRCCLWNYAAAMDFSGVADGFRLWFPDCYSRRRLEFPELDPRSKVDWAEKQTRAPL